MDQTRARDLLRQTLAETPETVIWLHLLRRGNCTVYLSGETPPFAAAILQPTDAPEEPTGFGFDMRAMWQLLSRATGWQCVLVDRRCAPEMGRIMARHLRARMRYVDDVYHVIEPPAPIFNHDCVRRLTLGDVPLLEAAPPDLRPTGFWGDFRNCLREGMAAGAVVDGHIVALAQVAAKGSRYADIGVYTLESHRRRGLATACASLAARWAQGSGLIPVWSCGDFNLASLNLARKLGFAEVSRRTAVTLESYLAEVSKRTYPVPGLPLRTDAREEAHDSRNSAGRGRCRAGGPG